MGSSGGLGVDPLFRSLSRFFSAVRRKILMVVRKFLCGVQSVADSGECSHRGHADGSFAWHLSQIAWPQQGRRKASTASLLQTAHRSFAGISSGDKDLGQVVSGNSEGDTTANRRLRSPDDLSLSIGDYRSSHFVHTAMCSRSRRAFCTGSGKRLFLVEGKLHREQN